MKYNIAILLLFFLGHSSSVNAQPVFEFRAVWVASVENIDWPSKKGLSVNAQQSEFIHVLDMHQSNGMNAVLVQIRPAADAFYPSQYEPWSEYLMGKQGMPPTPYYDPLQFMIEETHKRGMEFHAWLNPYRAVFRTSTSSVSPSHITKIHPEWFVNYANQKIFNPGLPEVREHVARVVKDIVSRYEVDGIHMDDYFYPYPDKKSTDFGDKKAFEKYGNGLKKADWRRSNCDSIIKMMHEIILNTNPHVKFGVSPFGVWRNKSQDPMGSNTKGGVTNYDDLYADILLWMKQGWIDYVTPQLYWERGHKLCDYDVLLDWWNQHAYGKHIYVGHGIYRAGTNAAWKDKNELPNQIKKLREYSTTQGSVYFSSKSFETNPNGWCDSLRNNYYALPALPPSMPWIDSIAPTKPIIEKLNDGINRLKYTGSKKIKGYVLFTINEGQKEAYENAQMVQLIVLGKAGDIDAFKWFNQKKRLFVSTVDWNNNVSDWVEFK
ncbi:MAG: family 10 glycosylhydrolase [Chitinophagaceae bacterium]|nr:family 10 glycosylhydrolase [Chitinophagaceae bacterium]